MSGERDLDPVVSDLIKCAGAVLSASKTGWTPAAAEAEKAVGVVIGRLSSGRLETSREAVDSVVAAAVLLDYVQMSSLSDSLLMSCRPATNGEPAHKVVATAQAAIHARRGSWEFVEGVLDLEDVPGLDDRSLRIAVDLALSAVYGRGDASSNDLARGVGIDAFRDRPILWFTLASAAFENAMLHAEARLAGQLLRQMEISSAAVVNEIGADHPYLGLVLLTLASAKCSRAATEGNVTELRRCADILAVAVQRAASQLGDQHPHTVGGLANLAHAEFEIALASRAVDDLTRSVEDLRLLRQRVFVALGQRHPIAVAVEMNAAVAGLEIARMSRSSATLDAAARELRATVDLATEVFGAFHPRAAVAATNAALAEFDLARSRHSTFELERALAMFERTRLQTENSLGANHAVAVVIKRQIQACQALLSTGPPADDRAAGGAATIVETRTDELWDAAGDYVSIHQATLPPSDWTRRRKADTGSEENFLAAIENTLAAIGLADESASRDLLLALVHDNLGVPLPLPVSKGATGREQLVAIVVACSKVPGGMDALVQAVRMLRPSSPEEMHLRTLVSNHQLRADEYQAAVPQRLLERATNLFAKKGFDRTSVQEIAEAAGVTKGEMYHYFASKDDLLCEIYTRVLREQTRQLESVASSSAPLRERLAAAASDVVVSSIDNLDDNTIFLRSMHQLSPDKQKAVWAERRKYQERFRGLIEEGQRSGEFRTDKPADVVVDFFFGSVQHLGSWYRHSGSLTARQIGDHYADLLLDALRPPAG